MQYNELAAHDFKWYRIFRDGRTDVFNKSRVGRQSTVKMTANEKSLNDMILSNRGIKIKKNATELNIFFYGTVLAIILDQAEFC